MWTRTTPPKPQRQSSPKHRLTSHVQPAIGHHPLPSARASVSLTFACAEDKPAMRSNHETTAETRRTAASLAPRRRSGRSCMSAGTDVRGIDR